MKKNRKTINLISLIVFFTFLACYPNSVLAEQRTSDDPNPPINPVKLIFIHHSTGENWLTEGYGNLGHNLAENNYFVSDTNYGWGPNSIGDRTDIPDWLEWFASDQTSTYMDALFNENGQNSYYTRLFDDPGGENEVVLFKSCFPNSALEGNPNDSPSADGWLSVGHAKFVYNEILEYFSTRPDKLFIVITAPPLSDPTFSGNARAFNQWLLNDWLNENNYFLPNVAVFDFYNILTDRNAHHWWNEGQIEYIIGNQNTLAYPSGDDHPSEAGSRKATDEFIPILNVFYHRWATYTPSETETEAEIQPETTLEGGVPLPPETELEIDDFEIEGLEWEAFWDPSTTSTISCTLEKGTSSQGISSMRIDFSIVTNSWGTCARFFETPQNWNQGEWLAYDIRYEQSGIPFSVILYNGSPGSDETYAQVNQTGIIYPDGFITYTANWNDFLRVAWEENAGAVFNQVDRIVGLGFGFDGLENTSNSGTIWIDNVRLEKSPTYNESDPSIDDINGSANENDSDTNDENGTNRPGFTLPCLGSLILPGFILGIIYTNKKPKKRC